jgi:hypothetical protein
MKNSNNLIKMKNCIKFKSIVLLFIAIIFTQYLTARSFYFSSSSGNDTYTISQAQNAATPWKSISKLNTYFSSLLPGDNVYFKRGDIFYGAIVVVKSGTSTLPITLGAYGTGNKPIISGFSSLTNWFLVGNGIYQATIPSINNAVNMLTLNNRPQPLGRYPNASDVNGGFLSFESRTSSSITDNDLAATPSWTGAELVIKKDRHVIERWPINNHVATTITYLPTSKAYIIPSYATNNANGYFIQKNIKCLDLLGEWFYNTSTKYVQMYFGSSLPAAYNIKISTVDMLVNTGKNSNIMISDISFEGANNNAINIGSSQLRTSNIAINNCDINFSGADAIYATNADKINVQNCNINFSYNNAVEIENEGGIGSFASIRNNNIKNTGVAPGMSAAFGNTDQAITAYNSDAVIEYNNIDSTGYIGIAFYYNNAKVRNNFISNFAFVKDDGGGIYTWSGPLGGPVYSGREVKNNILLNGIGNGFGTTKGGEIVYGIYMDDGVRGVDITGNSISNIASSGMYIHNSHEVNIVNNTMYNCGVEQTLFVHDNITPTDPIRNVVFKKNIMVSKGATQLSFNIRSIKEDINLTGVKDSNYYARPIDDNIVVGALSPLIKTSYSLEGWKATYTAFDVHSKKSPKKILPYLINSLVSANLFTNGDFASNILGVTVWSQNANQVAAWDNTNKLGSTGSLRLSFLSAIPNIYTLCTKPVGALSSTKKYIVRFSTVGNTAFGSFMVYLNNPVTNTKLTAIQTGSFNTPKKDHEFVFFAPNTAAAANFVIGIQQNSGTTYLDNLSFYEALITPVDINTEMRYDYNASNTTKTISLDAKYIGIDSSVYDGTITLLPYTAKVLIKSGAASVTTSSPLQSTATAANISCYGENGFTTVTASGGKSPYTGTGSFSIDAGKGSLKIEVPQSVATNYTMLYATIGAISSTKNYLLRFSTFGTTNFGSLRTAIRQTNTPWSTITPKQTKAFGLGRMDHEFIFAAPSNETAASFLIEILQSSGTTYIDNISFFECSSNSIPTGDNLYSGGQFENSINNIYKWSPTNNHLASLDLTSKITNTYYYPVKDAAGVTSIATAATTQPTSALFVTATAANVTTTGGKTTIVVTATGGTAPYSGTGSFSNMPVGTYNYTVIDAKGCTSAVKITVVQSAARMANATTSTIAIVTADSSLVLNTQQKILAKPIAKLDLFQASVYPNPSANDFNVIIKGNSGQLAAINVFSSDGRKVFSTNVVVSNTISFGSNIVAGIYFIHVLCGEKMQIIKVMKI